MNQLAIGARVRVLVDAQTERRDGEYFYRKGDIGTVLRFDALSVEIDFNGVDSQYAFQAGQWYAGLDEIEVIE